MCDPSCRVKNVELALSTKIRKNLTSFTSDKIYYFLAPEIRDALFIREIRLIVFNLSLSKYFYDSTVE